MRSISYGIWEAQEGIASHLAGPGSDMIPLPPHFGCPGCWGHRGLGSHRGAHTRNGSLSSTPASRMTEVRFDSAGAAMWQLACRFVTPLA